MLKSGPSIGFLLMDSGEKMPCSTPSPMGPNGPNTDVRCTSVGDTKIIPRIKSETNSMSDSGKNETRSGFRPFQGDGKFMYVDVSQVEGPLSDESSSVQAESSEKSTLFHDEQNLSCEQRDAVLIGSKSPGKESETAILADANIVRGWTETTEGTNGELCLTETNAKTQPGAQSEVIIKVEPEPVSHPQVETSQEQASVVSSLLGGTLSEETSPTAMSFQRERILSAPQRLLMCETCLTFFPYPSALRRHMSVHTSERPFACEACGLTYKYISDLNSHRLSKHHTSKTGLLASNRKRHWTGKDGESTAGNGGDETINQSGTDSAVYEKAVSSVSSAHMLSNSRMQLVMAESSPDSTPAVSDSFKEGADVTVKNEPQESHGSDFRPGVQSGSHKKETEEDKRFCCTECGAFFKQSGTLNEHMRVHTGERPFPCPYCYFSFKRSTHLKVHILRKHMSCAATSLIMQPFKQSATDQDRKLTRDKYPVPGARFSSTLNLPTERKAHAGRDSTAEYKGRTSFTDDMAALRYSVNLSTHFDVENACKLEAHPFRRESEERAIDLSKLHSLQHSSLSNSSTPTKNNVLWSQVINLSACNSSHRKEIFGDRVEENTVGDEKQEKPNSVGGRFVCMKCYLPFKEERLYNEHMKIHNGERPHPCPHCSFHFKRSTHLKIHIQRKHSRIVGSMPVAGQTVQSKEKQTQNTGVTLVVLKTDGADCTSMGSESENVGVTGRVLESKDRVVGSEDTGSLAGTAHDSDDTEGVSDTASESKNTVVSNRFSESEDTGCASRTIEFEDSNTVSVTSGSSTPEDPNVNSTLEPHSKAPDAGLVVKLEQSWESEPEVKCDSCQQNTNRHEEECKQIIAIRLGDVALESEHIVVNSEAQDISSGWENADSCTENKEQKTGDRRYSCTECGASFKQSGSLNEHRRVHTGERPFPCTQCHLSFKRSTHLKTHMLRKHVVLETESKTVSESRMTETSTVDAEGYGSSFVTNGDADEPKPLPFPCSGCEASFRYQCELNQHARKHTGERPFICSICSTSFGRSGNLRAHMRIHTGEKPYACTVCQIKFSLASKLRSHILRRHTPGRFLKFRCCECDARFVYRSGLKKHRRSHQVSKPFPCRHCSASFHTAHSLETHTIRIHSSKKSLPYICSVCASSFMSQGELNRHSRVHTGEKPFPCSECYETFAQAGTLKRHMKRKHRVVKPLPRNTDH